MNDNQKKSILQMARGAILERADYETTRIMENILDVNTKATAKRKLTITLEFIPDDERQTVVINCVAKSNLAPTNPVITSLYVADDDNVVEMVPQIPGQFAIDEAEQEEPPVLKLIKMA